MDPYLAKIYATAGIASTAAICASALNRFRNVPAGSFALAGGIVPWIIIAMLYHWPNAAALFLGLVIIGPLFLVAFVFYSYEEPTAMRNVAAAVTIVGMSAGITFSIFLGYPLLLQGL